MPNFQIFFRKYSARFALHEFRQGKVKILSYLLCIQWTRITGRTQSAVGTCCKRTHFKSLHRKHLDIFKLLYAGQSRICPFGMFCGEEARSISRPKHVIYMFGLCEPRHTPTTTRTGRKGELPKKQNLLLATISKENIDMMISIFKICV